MLARDANLRESFLAVVHVVLPLRSRVADLTRRRVLICGREAFRAECRVARENQPELQIRVPDRLASEAGPRSMCTIRAFRFALTYRF
jgi:hypothetical protein